MREITKNIKIYTFDELNEEAQEKALDNEREVTLSYEWWEWILDDLQEQCAKFGIIFKTNDVFFDLGRGAYLYIYSENLSFKWKSEVDLPVKFGAYQNYHGGGINEAIQSEFVDDFRVRKAGKESCAYVAMRVNNCLEIFERTLEKLWQEHQEIQTDEYLIDIIKGNDLEYTEEGEIYNG